MRKQLRIAIIACDMPDHIPRRFRGKNRNISRILGMRLFEMAKKVQVGLNIITHRIPKRHYHLPDPDYFNAVLISGSMSDISNRYLLDNDWMKRLLDYIRYVHNDLPMLGVCFGHQAIGRAFGSHLDDLSVPEEGFYPLTLTDEGRKDQLFKGVPNRFMALFSHGQYISPPPGVLLAQGDSPSVQAFRIGEHTWGVQFHPDFSPETVRSSLNARRKELEERKLDVDKALKERLNLPDEERFDTLPLLNFVKYVSGL